MTSDSARSPGWIKLHRKIDDWCWLNDTNTFATFIHLLLLANTQNKKWRTIIIKRGSFVTSVAELAKRIGVSVQQTRTSLDKLISTNEITRSTTSNYTVISINNYEQYQKVTKSVTNEQQTDNKPITTTKEYKNIRSNNNIIISGVPTGNIFVDQILKEFKERFGFNPTDPKPRNEAWNLTRRIKSFLKEINRESDEPTTLKVITRYFQWLDKQDWFENCQGLGVIRRKFEIYKSEYINNHK